MNESSNKVVLMKVCVHVFVCVCWVVFLWAVAQSLNKQRALMRGRVWFSPVCILYLLWIFLNDFTDVQSWNAICQHQSLNLVNCRPNLYIRLDQYYRQMRKGYWCFKFLSPHCKYSRVLNMDIQQNVSQIFREKALHKLSLLEFGYNFMPIPSWVLLSCQQSFSKDGWTCGK